MGGPQANRQLRPQDAASSRSLKPPCYNYIYLSIPLSPQKLLNPLKIRIPVKLLVLDKS